jgi:putative glutamine amidotransferase
MNVHPVPVNVNVTVHVNDKLNRPLVAVPAQTLQAMDGIPESLPHSWVMNHRYFSALMGVGAAPWIVPLVPQDESAMRALYESAAGIFLAGGVDVDPASYGEEKLAVCGRTDPDRDDVELLWTRWAMADGKPLLGVCRGMQVINVACGGTLYQDLQQQSSDSIKHDYFPTQGYARDHLAHEAAIQPAGQLRAIFGADSIRVNSMHHQGIRQLGSGLTGSIVAPDGLIEGLECNNGAFVLGVQWHPETLIERDAGMRRLFSAFVDAARAFAVR